MTLNRRTFLGAMVAAVAGCTTGPEITTPSATSSSTASTTTTFPTTTTTLRPVVEPLDPPESALTNTVFGLGVASGDPASDSVVLWTRLMPTEVDAVPDAAQLLWEVSYDEDFAELAATGMTDVGSGFAHTAHVIAGPLAPDTRYFYRFRVGEATSPVGRTRTMAAAGSTPGSLTLGVSSCQRLTTGHWAAHRDMAESDVDLVLWLGDFIYGGSESSPLEGRSHQGSDPVGLGAYRERYAQYRRDPQLQQCSAAHPWVVTWDDHEVVNDYDAGVDPARRAAAYQAWWEHQPTRVPAPGSTGFDIYRSIDAGDLCRVTLLDTRQYADGSTLLGPTQQEWLAEQLDHDKAWTVLGSSVLVAGLLVPIQADVLLPYTWDGYPNDRAWLADELAKHPNRLCVSGDLHTGAVLEVQADPADRSLPVVATEFMAPAISSPFPADYDALAPFLTLANAHLEHIDTDNGWLRLEITADGASAEFRTIDDLTDPNSAITSAATFDVTAGDPTPRQR